MNIFNNKFYRFLLVPFTIIYALIIWVRNKLYDNRIFRCLKIDQCKLISVGNIAVGGTGKTPVIKFLAGYLSQMGFKVAILSRGYRRTSSGTVIVSNGRQILTDVSEAGDEPYLLARQLTDIPVVVEANRYKGAQIIQQNFHPDIILLDDAYQHRRLHRDCDIVLVDTSVGFGNKFLLPTGFLREPVKNLSRADLIWLTRVNQAKNLDNLVSQVKRYTSSPLITSEHRATAIFQANTNKSYRLSYMNQKRVLLFSGIANPHSFAKTVIGLGAKVVHHLIFSDHYRYQKKDINKVINKASNFDAEIILTTEKDFARISKLVQGVTNIYYLTIKIHIGNYYHVLDHILKPVLVGTTH